MKNYSSFHVNARDWGYVEQCPYCDPKDPKGKHIRRKHRDQATCAKQGHIDAHKAQARVDLKARRKRNEAHYDELERTSKSGMRWTRL